MIPGSSGTSGITRVFHYWWLLLNVIECCSFHEIGNYDLPAVIDYILDNTGKEKLSYVGHSQGTTIFFACMASRPEYNDKITLMIALAPVAHMTHMTHPLVRFMGNPIINLGLGVSNYCSTNYKVYNVQYILVWYSRLEILQHSPTLGDRYIAWWACVQ